MHAVFPAPFRVGGLVYLFVPGVVPAEVAVHCDVVLNWQYDPLRTGVEMLFNYLLADERFAEIWRIISMFQHLVVETF